MKYSKLFIIAVIFLIFGKGSYGQSVSLTEIRDYMKDAYSVFDNSYYLSFDINFNYASYDASNSVIKSENKVANYVVKGSNFYLNMDEVLCMQNNDYNITLLKREKMIMLSKSKPQDAASSTIPKIDFFDASWTSYYEHYNITKERDEETNTSTITFKSTAPNAVPYDTIVVICDDSTHRMKSMEFYYQPDIPIDNPEALEGSLVAQYQKMTVNFSNYAFNSIEPKVFEASQYVYFDNKKKVFVLNDAYRGWKLIVSGVEQSNYSESDSPAIGGNPPLENN